MSLIQLPFHPEWGSIIAGATAASALALVLHAFALAIGLSVRRHRPGETLRLHLFALLAALASYGLGGYLAGCGSGLTSRENADLRDEGLLVWALATLLTTLIGLATAHSLTPAHHRQLENLHARPVLNQFSGGIMELEPK